MKRSFPQHRQEAAMVLEYKRLHFLLYCISLGPQPVGVQCPLTSSLGEFTGYWDWLRYPGLLPVLVSIAFPLSPSISRCFPFTLYMPLDFIRVSFLRPTYLHPFDLPFTFSF